MKCKYSFTKLMQQRLYMLLACCLALINIPTEVVAQTVSPGGVSSRLRYWSKADAGISNPTDNAAVTTWADQSGNGFNVSQSIAARQPRYKVGTPKYNFNPTLAFGGAATIGNLLSNSIIPSNTASVTMIHVTRTSTEVGGYKQIVSFGGGLDLPSDHIFNNFLRSYVDGTAPILDDSPIIPEITLKPTIGYSRNLNAAGSNGGRNLGFNGIANMQVTPITNGDFNAGGTTTNFAIGSEQVDNLVESFDGDIQEVIVYDRVLTDTELKRVQTYLAIKYGVTLDNLTDYIKSDGTTLVWPKTNSSSYGFNIFGVAKDPASGLDQKVSKSFNAVSKLIIATTEDFASANQDANRTSLADGQYFMVGDNGTDQSLYTTFNSCLANGATQVKLNAVWKVKNTGNVGNLYFNMNFTGAGITEDPVMLVSTQSTFAAGTYRMVIGKMNADGTATFAAKVNDGEYFTFMGVRGTGVCPKCTGAGVITWERPNNHWPSPTTTNTQVTRVIGGTDATAKIIWNDPQGVEYAKAVRPWSVGKDLLLERWDNFTPTGTPNGGAYTGVFTLDKASRVTFTIKGIDRWAIGVQDIVEVRGYCGTTLITPKLSYVKPVHLSSYTISGNIATGNQLWSGHLNKRGWMNVDFDRSVDKIEIIWKSTKSGTGRRFQQLFLSAMIFDCPLIDPCLNNDDNVLLTKTIMGTSTLKTCEYVRFRYKIQNLNCSDKVVNLADVLPAGMQWVSDSFEGESAGGTVNGYAGTSTFNLASLPIPAGQTVSVYLTAKFTNQNAASYGNRATMTVNGGSAGTISSNCANTTWTATAATPAPVPTVSHSIVGGNTCYEKNKDLTVQVNFNNNTGSPITKAVYNLSLQDEFILVGNSISTTFSGTVTTDDGTPNYGGQSQLEITGMTIPAGASSFTFKINAGSSDSTLVLQSTISADPETDCATEASQSSNEISLKLCPPCNAGTAVPVITQTAATNTCPATTVNLATMTNTGSVPAGTTLVWSSRKTPNSPTDTVSNLNVGAGKYYALYRDKVNACFSTGGADSVTVTIGICTSTPPVNSPSSGANQSGNAQNELTPTGGTGPYTYSNGSGDPQCVAPSGASPLPPSSNFTVQSNGSYSYITPTTPGVYYYCIKVCDSSTPAICKVVVYTISVAQDTDGDGTPDSTDLDDDNDGLVDTVDKLPLDTDNDGTPNATDTDDDGDGILDSAEQSGKALDTDNDGTPNETDTDDDNDGVLDTSEIGTVGPDGKFTLPDSDADGLPDLADILDTDGDGIPDSTDLDDDNDGLADTVDKLPLDTDNDGTPNVTDTDDDGDGILDSAEQPGKALDTDNDGTPNETDTDDDNDGVLDTSEIGTLGPDGKYTLPDSDADGLPDLADVLDTDGDGIPDSTDTDDDNDGLADTVDKFPLDTDNDGTPNATDTDDDGDGILDSAEQPGKALDTDNDGTPNATDTDDDNDGILDNSEIGTLGPDGKYTLPDSNNNGLPDLADAATSIVINSKVFLQGPLSVTTMTTNLNTSGLIPLTDPYGKGATTTSGTLSTNSITDWVLVELRSAQNVVTESIAVLLKSDGTIVNPDGTSPLKFTTTSGSYYVAVRHRNHLGVMTANAISLSTTAQTIDFTLPSTATFSPNAQKTVGSVKAMWAGNATGINSTSPDKVIYAGSSNDVGSVRLIALSIGTLGTGSVVSGYRNSDLNLDGNTIYAGANSDTALIRLTVLSFPSNILGTAGVVNQNF